MKRQRLIGSVCVAAILSLAVIGCDGGDNKPDENLCRADCGRDLAASVQACGASDETCLNQSLDKFDICLDDCHDQGAGQ